MNNTNTKKPFDKSKNKPKAKMITTMYEKAFDSFKDMIDEFRNIHPEFSQIFTYDDDEVKPEYAASDALNYFSKNMPIIANRSNLPVSVSACANKVTLKTAKFFSVEWNFKYDKEGNITDLVAIITTFTRERNYEELDNLINSLEATWTKKEFQKKNFNK